MADQKQLEILKQGVQAWNEWRAENVSVPVDLSGADLRDLTLFGAILNDVDLRRADLSNANLMNATLIDATLKNATLSNVTFTAANLGDADLRGAFLRDADLIRSNLNGANLNGANLGDAALFGATLKNAKLIHADLRDADLRRANLSGADLSRAVLHGVLLYDATLFDATLKSTNLSGADLSGARLGDTIFGNVDLSTTKGLEAMWHFWPSTIGIDTILRSQGKIPEVFLRRAGVPNSIIEAIPSLLGSLSPSDYYSCFISYSSKDEVFAKRLHDDLVSEGVNCWFAPENLKWGEHIRIGIDEAIRLHDKLLLILSRSSVASGWVEREVRTALARERKEKRTVLFPVRVDKAVFESPFAWATEIRHERNIGDFCRWKDHDEYQKAFARLLRDLQVQ